MRVVIINCFDTYEHRVDLLLSYFEGHMHSVRVIASDFRHFKKKFRSDKKKNFHFIHVKPYRKNISVQRLNSHHDFSAKAVDILSSYSPDLVWVMLPPNSLAKEGALYKKKYPNVRLVFDFIDMWPEALPISNFKYTFFYYMWKRKRDRYLGFADKIVTECNLYQNLIRKNISDGKIETLYLARNDKQLETEVPLNSDKVVLCYIGSINHLIDISLIITIANAFKKPVLVHVIGNGEKKEKLIQKLKINHCEVIAHGEVYDADEKQRIFNQCHFGLNIMKENTFVGLTMKSMDYLEAGLPIINNIQQDTFQLVERYSIGINVSSENINEEMLNTYYERYTENTKKEVQKIFKVFFTTDAFYKKLDYIINSFEEI